MESNTVLERVKAGVGLVFLVVDICFVVVCSILHFLRGGVQGGTVQGTFTLILFFTAGLITNLFHLFRHEWPRMEQRSLAGKLKCYVLVFIPCASLLRWYIGRFRNPESISRRCWTASLRLFYCTGTLTQAVLQGYVVVHLWWTQDIPAVDVYVTITAAVIFSVHAIYGVCGYIWTGYYDEKYTNLLVLDYTLIIVAITFNMGGRVAVMAVVMGTLGWYWLAVAAICPLLINYIYTIYLIKAPLCAVKGIQIVYTCLFLLPLAFLSAITVSKNRILTIITTMVWLACSLPQIVVYHGALSQWLVWCIPASGQVIAFVIMMVKWSVFEAAFERFGRLIKVNQFIKVPAEPYEGPRASY